MTAVISLPIGSHSFSLPFTKLLGGKKEKKNPSRASGGYSRDRPTFSSLDRFSLCLGELPSGEERVQSEAVGAQARSESGVRKVLSNTLGSGRGDFSDQREGFWFLSPAWKIRFYQGAESRAPV